MKKILSGLAAIAVAALIGAGLYLWTPAPAGLNRAAALTAGEAYAAEITRDQFGVPHIYGARDVDVAFGLAYAHAGDDWATIAEVILFSRGKLAETRGRDAAITDYLIQALGANDAIADGYERDLSEETRALVEAYAAGLNFWCAEDQDRCKGAAAPVTGRDVVAGFAARSPFFYGLEEHLTRLFEGGEDDQARDEQKSAALDQFRAAFLRVPEGGEMGSNAMAVAPTRSADGHTRLMVNSHQPFTGPVAWYEARVKSDEGWDMIGALFPGAPMVLHGAGPRLGWAFTVNKPDLVDLYELRTDREKNPSQYYFDGGWRDFEVSYAEFRVKLLGPFSLPVKRRILRSVHGPVLETAGGHVAIAFAGDRDIRAVEQYYRLNKAQNFDEWRAAMAMLAIPSLNVVYADQAGNIGYFYNAALPVRAPEWDWSKPAPGERADLVWRGTHPFSAVPQVVNPKSGYVINANNAPFEASAPGDAPTAEAFPAHFGVANRSTNRGVRLSRLFEGDEAITAEAFLRYKMDKSYDETSRLMGLIAETLADNDLASDENLEPVLQVLAGWGGEAGLASRGAALSIRYGQLMLGGLLNGEGAEMSDRRAALTRAASELQAGFGRIDPEWGAVNRLKRGDIDVAVAGGPDLLRAIYSADSPSDGSYEASAGDSYILYADWPAPGQGVDGAAKAPMRLQTIHQFGSATLDERSEHYADQAVIFAGETFRTPPMTDEALRAEATSFERIGGAGP